MLKNCVSVSNKVKGFDQNNNNGAMTIYNCTSYSNGTNYGFSNSGYGTLLIKNSVSLGGTSSNSFKTTSYTQSNNTWSSGFSCSSSDFVSLDVSQILNARQTDGSLPEMALLHLSSTSTLKDKGVDVGIQYSGLAPDLGAFEYKETTPVRPVMTDNVQIIIYPNPVNENSAISIMSVYNENATIQIMDVTGRIVQKFISPIKTGENSIRLNLTTLKSGNYFCTIVSKNLNYTCKFIK